MEKILSKYFVGMQETRVHPVESKAFPPGNDKHGNGRV